MPVQNDLSPFGQHVPHGLLAGVLRLTRRRRPSWIGRRFGFVCRSAGIALLRGQPQDVDALGARMRLYPAHNVSEKNLLFTPHLFDPEERNLLKAHIRPGFTFIDVGANVGGYALFVAALAGPHARILAIEPQPDIFERLVYNVRQNPFGSVKALECAVTDQDGDITMFLDPANSGESSMRFVNARRNSGAIKVASKALATIVHEERFPSLDALKVDVEGAEDLVLDPFFRDVAPALWPRLLIVDNASAHALQKVAALGGGKAYARVLQTRSNDVFARSG
jgi:FkbM family methyltransferase